MFCVSAHFVGQVYKFVCESEKNWKVILFGLRMSIRGFFCAQVLLNCVSTSFSKVAKDLCTSCDFLTGPSEV